MATPRRDAKSLSQTPAPSRPPYYIAVEPLFVGGNQFARAHNPGDRVLPEHVDAYGWQRLVRPPDGYTAPDHTPNTPETDQGQATSSKEGDL